MSNVVPLYPDDQYEPVGQHHHPEDVLPPHVLKRIDATGDCWEMAGSRSTGGYTIVQVDGVAYASHRYVWQQLVGPIPEGMQVDHLCFNTACVNPDHLRVVTPAENTATRRVNGLAEVIARRKAKTHCIRGHEYTPENTLRNGREKTRRCRICTYTIHAVPRRKRVR